MTLAYLSAATAAKTSARGTEAAAKPDAGDKSTGRGFESLLTKASADGQPAKEPMRIVERRASWDGQLAQQAGRQDDGADASAADPAVSIAVGIAPVDCEQDQVADDTSAADGEASDGHAVAGIAGSEALVQSSSTADTRSTATAIAPAGLPTLQGSVAVAIATVLAVTSPPGGQMVPTASATDGETVPQGMGGGRAATEPRAQNAGAAAATLDPGGEQMRAVSEAVAGGRLTVVGQETFMNPMRAPQLGQAVLQPTQPTSPSNAADVTPEAPEDAGGETGSTSGVTGSAIGKGVGLANASAISEPEI